TKKIAIVPCSAKSGQGISELLYVLCGLCQRFLKTKLTIAEASKGVILEVKKDKGTVWAEAILYDGSLDEGDQLVIASLEEPIITKVRAIQEILPLSNKFKPSKKVIAASGVKIQLTEIENILPGMPFQEVKEDLEKIKISLKDDLSSSINTDKEGIIVKADSLGSLEALLTLLKQEKISVLKAGIGPINKSDVVSAKANLEINPLDSIILGFNTNMEEDLDKSKIKIITNEVIYKLIEDITAWRKKKQGEIEKERLLGLATICKLEILPKYIFRNSNPAIFGVRILTGKIKINIPLIDENGEEVARVKSLQLDKSSVERGSEGQELAMALPGIAFDRRLKDIKFLYTNISDSQFKEFKKNKDLLSSSELKTLQEISLIKEKMKK
ncbi:translation initiation factor IF-2, partial [Candidatus Pacearchaeota archaeon]|nr:translation initiation factor IF-2 [Candidatus Pacearchaeota archaeon]